MRPVERLLNQSFAVSTDFFGVAKFGKDAAGCTRVAGNTFEYIFVSDELSLSLKKDPLSLLLDTDERSLIAVDRLDDSDISADCRLLGVEGADGVIGGVRNGFSVASNRVAKSTEESEPDSVSRFKFDVPAFE